MSESIIPQIEEIHSDIELSEIHSSPRSPSPPPNVKLLPDTNTLRQRKKPLIKEPVIAEKHIPYVPHQPVVPPEIKRGGISCGSYFLIILQFFISLGCLVGGSVMLGLSKKSVNDGKGELPIRLYVFFNKIHGYNVCPGYVIGAALLVAGIFYLIDALLLIPSVYDRCCGKGDVVILTTTDAHYDKRFDLGRRTRRHVRLFLTWPLLYFALLLVTGEFYEQVYYALIPQFATSLALILLCQEWSSAAEVSLASNIPNNTIDMANRASHIISTGTQINVSAAFSFYNSVAPLLVLWQDYYYSISDSSTPLTDRMASAVWIFTGGYLLYWFLATLASISRCYAHQTWFATLLNPIGSVFIAIMRPCGADKLFTKIMDNGFFEEIVVAFIDLLFFFIVSWFTYDEVVQEVVTLPV